MCHTYSHSLATYVEVKDRLPLGILMLHAFSFLDIHARIQIEDLTLFLKLIFSLFNIV